MKTIRRIKLGEGMLYKAIRLRALGDAPEAFGSSLEDALLRSEESWHVQADQSAKGSARATFFAMQNDQPVGLAALYQHDNSEDTTELIQMWVAPESRSYGTAKILLDHAFAWAKENGYSRIQAEVVPSNTHALRFYKRYGFTEITQPSTHTDDGIILEHTLPH